MAGLKFKVWNEHVDGMHYQGAFKTYAAAKAKANRYVGKHGTWFTKGYAVGEYGDNVYIARNDGRRIESEVL